MVVPFVVSAARAVECVCWWKTECPGPEKGGSAKLLHRLGTHRHRADAQAGPVECYRAAGAVQQNAGMAVRG